MPNGTSVCIPVYEGESVKEKLNNHLKYWYEYTNKDPKKFGFFDIKDKCPSCGGTLRCSIHHNEAYIWCIDHQCGYRRIEADSKTREIVFETLGFKNVTHTHKKGSSVILSKKPINKK